MRMRILSALLAASSFLALPAAAQLRYGPYIQNTAHDRATIVWYTANVTTGILRYGLAPGNWQNQITVAADSAHFVEVSGLAADQRYYYEVADPAAVYATGAEYYFDTHPEIGCTKPFTFAAFGDMGMLEQVQFDVAARLKIEDDARDFSVLLGDIVYSSGERIDYKPKYFDVYQDVLRHEAWWAGLGNHDIRDNGGAAYFEFFVTPANNPYQREHFYSFDYGSAHFVAIDNELHLEEPGLSEQLNWIRADLQDAINRGQRWLIAFWHEAPYSGGTHSGDGFAKKHFIPIMDQFGVDLVLCGHSHVMERTFPMVNHAVINTHPNEYTKNAHQPGTVYIVSGAAGEEEALEQPGLPGMAFQRGATGGYAVITIEQDTLRGHFMTKTGEKLDPYRIVKTGLAPIAKQPVLDAIGNLTLAENDTSTHMLNASLADVSSPTTMTIANLPAFATFTDLGNGQGRLVLTPSFYQSGVYPDLKLTAENSCAISSKIISLTVNEVTDPPALAAVGNHTMDEGATLSLTLTASDPDNDALTFSVQPQPDFAALAALTGASAQLTFTPDFRKSGVYPMTVSVTDGHARAFEHITLTVRDTNRAPRIDSVLAAPNPVGDDGSVALQVFASDPDEGDTLSFAWQASAGAINGAGPSVTFVPPIVVDSSEVAIIVAASDGVGGAAQDTIALHVRHVNRAPVANAGADQFVSEGDTVRLNGAASSDFDPQPLSYHWRQLTGVAVALSDSNGVQPFFIAPRPEGEANFAFELMVHDGESASSPDTVRVTINSKPVLLNGIVAASDTVYDDATLLLTANASDADNDALAWQWRTTLDTLVGNGANARFCPPIVAAPALALIHVEVNDGRGGLTRDSLHVYVIHSNRTPIARAGADQFVSEGDTVRLNGAASSDFDPQPLSYHWRRLTGASVALSDSHGVQPFFIAPRPEAIKSFLFELTVHDGVMASAPDTVAITINTLPDIIGGIFAPRDTIPDTTTLALHANVSDADNDSLTLNWTTTHGALTGTGASVVFKPPILQDTTRVTISLNVQDGRGGVRNAMREIIVFHVNRAPIAHAGYDQNLGEGQLVNLNGHRSRDDDQQPLSYHWRQLTGIPVVLENAHTGHPKFVAPRPDSAANYFFELIVNDGLVNSAPDTVKININALPVAEAGIAQSVSEGESVVLDGSASSDWEAQPLRFRWRQLTGAQVALSDSQAVQPSFIAPRPQNNAFDFLFELIVNDGRDDGKPDTATVSINALPIAEAGENQFVTVGDTVALDGSASYDLEGRSLTYRWRQVRGVAVALSDSQAVQPRFIAPLPNGDAEVAFELIVHDGVIASAADTATIHINRNPVLLNGIAAAHDTLGDDATLALSAPATDADNDSLTWNWSATLGAIAGSGANVVFTPPLVTLPTPVRIALEVRDGKGGAARDSLALVVVHPNRLPIARAGEDQFVTEGDTVLLNGAASSDFEAQPLAYHWKQLTGVSVSLSDSNAVAPSFVAPHSDDETQFRFALTVHDGAEASAPDTVAIFINRKPLLNGIAAAHDTIADDMTLALHALASDADHDSLAFAWSATAGTISGAGAQVLFSPRLVTDTITANIRVQVSDGKGGSAQDSLRLVIYHGNDAPAARAGEDQFVTEGDTVRLSGALSSDPENQALSYLWRQIHGARATLSDSQAVAPYFIAPRATPDTTLRFVLKVHDGLDASAPDTLQIDVNNLPVIASLVAAQDSVADQDTLNVSASVAEVDGDALQFFWSTDSGAISNQGASALFLPPKTKTPFLAKIKLRVRDEHGGETQDSLALKVYHRNTPPVALAGADQNVTEGDRVTLDGRASHDAENDALTFTWRQISGPAIVFMDADSSQPSFYAAGVEATARVEIELTVRDGASASSPDTVSVLIAALPSTSGEATFEVIADASVRQGRPDKNYGTYPDLEAELDPQRRSYLRFQINGILGPIQSARLKLHANKDAPSGGTVHAVNDTAWSETGVNFNNAPAYAAGPIAQFGALLEKTDYEAEVTSGMNGNRAVSFALVSNNATPVSYSSREGGNAAKLWVKFGQSANLAPKILSGPSANPNPVGDDAAATVSVQALELEGDPLQYAWSTTFGTLSGAGASVTFKPGNVSVNTLATISVQISDGKGGFANGQTTLTVLPIDEAPLANAGSDRNADYGELVTLDGAASHDPEGAALTFDWLQIAGPSVTLSNANTAAPAFVAPTLNGSADLSFRLLVHDGANASAPDTVKINVADRSLTATFFASHDSYVSESYPSTNYNNDSTLVASLTTQRRTSYLRFHVSGIAGEVKAATVQLTAKANSALGGALSLISNSSWSEIGLLAKNAPAIDGPKLGSLGRIQKNGAYAFDALAHVWGEGVYSFALHADSLARYYARETLQPPRLSVKYRPAPDFSAQRPIANAGPNQSVNPAATVTLTGEASADPQSEALLFYWTQIAGVAASLSDLHAMQPQFIAPANAEGATLSFQLVVSDGKYASAPDTVQVSIVAPRQTATFMPTADAYVDANSPKKNYGTVSTVSAQSSPVRRGYLRFNVTGISNQVESAILRVTAAATASMGGAMHKITNNSWTESGLKYNNAPPVDGPELSRLGSVTKNLVYEFNVTAAIAGPGTYNFAYVSDNTAVAKFTTRESATPPQLLITYRASGLAKEEEEEEGIEAEESLPRAFELYPSYPNPFLVSMLSEPVTLKYALKEAGHVTLRLYNTLGQVVRTVVNEEKPAGLHWIRWNGRDQQGQEAGAGIYIYRLEVRTDNGGRFVATRKMTRVK
jgi:hypothetical protein